MSESSSSVHVADLLDAEIRSSPAGTRLPTNRELVKRFAVSATTVSHALAILGQRGLVDSRPGAGTFRSASAPTPREGDTSWQEAALARPSGGFGTAGLLGTLQPVGPEVVDLNGGYLHPDLQPLAALGAALTRAARGAGAWDRPPVAGLPDLRDWFATDIGGGLTRRDVLICGGGQAALATALRALAAPGAPVVLESPTYPGATAAAHAAGLRVIPVPLDGEGLRADHLDAALAGSGARVVVVQPLHQNPTTVSLSPQRRLDLREAARKHGAFLVEDDFARHLAHAGAPPTPPPLIADDPDGTVVHIRSLTKATSPNLRVAALAARGPALARLRAAHVVDTMFVPAPLQRTALEVVTGPAWRRTRTALSASLTERRTAATAAVRAVFGPTALPVTPQGGYHLWIPLPEHLDGAGFAAAALATGTALTPGENYQLTPTPTHHIRLSYAAAPTTTDIDTAIRRLAPLLDQR
ncbi:aminotransferase-like domain-containing protein [Actinokineospora bangkokensis]|uniref:GntR family transcriptional regulator n=1 Tax=Actinokineospora bangkokensis TaxID=1193682 RepID=A0A1Q9LL20_9PSEU|nr:PLP-dependent aminotransferase family protein [Actinokineospora bangkokensis]OLR92695.1 GntR family transcriptional regulator [Actinokineospora bangkokensis]